MQATTNVIRKTSTSYKEIKMTLIQQNYINHFSIYIFDLIKSGIFSNNVTKSHEYLFCYK
jgi:hypothetical protein